MEDKKIDETKEEFIRLEHLKKIEEAGINPFPAKSNRINGLSEALEMNEEEKVQTTGRLMSKREMGRICFCHLKDGSDTMQLVFSEKELGKEKFKFFIKNFDIADFIEVEGVIFTTHKGELSILIKEYRILTKALLPLPDKYHGLQDEEMKLRKRYLDILVNEDVKEMFIRRSKFWKATRDFLAEKGFMEVETPVLEASAGGADAAPFVTHHNALDMDVYLRISMGELWQKRLMVAGFEKTFEIGRQFRNEGMDKEHLQDYSQMEFYWSYADYEMGMELVEEMYKYIAEETFGTLKFDIGEFKDIDLDEKWERIDYVSVIKEKLGINVLKSTDEELSAKLKELGVKYDKAETTGRLIDTLWKQCRKSIKGPAFLINIPVCVSPLAKRMESNSDLTERFQPIIAGSELGNGYSELNDPLDQEKRFEEQSKMREAGDNEAQMHDHDFVEALKHGMPPTCGFGFSERLFSFLENKSIRTCQIFPLMKPEKLEDDKDKK